MSHWTWSPPITVRMIPKPVGSQAPAKLDDEATLLLTNPVVEPSHQPKAEDEE